MPQGQQVDRQGRQVEGMRGMPASGSLERPGATIKSTEPSHTGSIAPSLMVQRPKSSHAFLWLGRCRREPKLLLIVVRRTEPEVQLSR